MSGNYDGSLVYSSNADISSSSWLISCLGEISNTNEQQNHSRFDIKKEALAPSCCCSTELDVSGSTQRIDSTSSHC